MYKRQLFRYLGLDGSRYESVTLPFADTASIGDYALTAVKALYTEGIINGSTGADGRLYFNPGSSLTRAQEMCIRDSHTAWPASPPRRPSP